MSARVLGRAAPWFILGLASPALGAPPGGGGGETNAVSYEPAPSVRRDGFAMGMTMGFGPSQASGFENSVASISDPSNRVDTGLELGSSFSIWLGGAIRDWLSVGVGIASTTTLTGNPMGFNPALILHVEGFPLFMRGGTWQDLGIAIDGGLGTGTIVDRNQSGGQKPLAEGGSMSTVGATIFYEPLRFWHFSAGPSLSYTHAFSQSMNADRVILGFRLSLYGVVPERKKPEAAASGTSDSRF